MGDLSSARYNLGAAASSSGYLFAIGGKPDLKFAVAYVEAAQVSSQR
jgi:hypothetical protein